MATISKIAAQADIRVASTAQQPNHRAQPAESGGGHSAPRPALAPPKGVREVLKTHQEKEPETERMTRAQVKELVHDLQETLKRATREPHEVGFRQDSRTNTFVIEIKDKEGNLVKQFPPEKVLNLQQKLDELSGMVIDEMT